MTQTADERKAQLEAELRELAKQEQQEAEERQQAAVAERDALLDPEQKARKDAIEDRAREQLDKEWPPAWSPHKPDTGHPKDLVGLVLRIDPRVGPSKVYGTYSAVLEVRSTDGQEWTIWANEQGALYAQMFRLRIQPGEVIGIRYRGKKDSEANPGQSYHDFRLVRVDDDEPAHPVDYDALSRASETPALPEGGGASTKPPDDDIPF